LTASLPFTGERFTPEVKGAIWYEHWHRYSVMLPLARGRRVLDAACGEGYGSWLLAQSATEVVGVDLDPLTIRHAQTRYASQPNLRYVQASCTALPLPAARTDLIVSFETIEHLQGQETMIAEFRRVLAPSGALVISSPNKAVYSDESGYANEFHVRELFRAELEAMLDTHFPQQVWYGQRVLAHSLLWKEQQDAVTDAEIVELTDDRVRLRAAPAPPMYFVVVCGARESVLPQLSGLSLFDDGKQSLYRDYDRALRAEQRLYWDEIDARKIAEDRQTQLVAAVNELASTREHAAALSTEFARMQTQHGELVTALESTRQRLAFRETWKGWMLWPLARARSRLGRRAP
jgi:ubiquinone/menaquinone biosynthesis C-methylase UbiE